MTGRGSSWPARRKRRIWSQVSYILRPGDAVQREPLEDDVAGEVHLGRPARRAQQVDPAAQPRRGERLGVAARVAAHLADEVDAVAAGQLADPGQHVVGGRD